MSKIETRIEKVEKTLNLDGEPRVVQIVVFCEGTECREERQGNVIVRYVTHKSLCQDGQEGAKQA